MAADPVSIGFGLPFQEQIDFFRAKLNLPTERWDDIKKQANDRAFIVAGAAYADLLQDLREAIDKAITEGKGIAEFRKDFKRIVKMHGWHGWTGEGTKAGEAWRTRTIYTTNLNTSYAAGRYKQLTDPEYLKLRPNWIYIHNDSVVHPRPHHLSWHGTVLPHDHPFWQSHFAPNGWGCKCRIAPARDGQKVTAPPQGWDKIDPKTGEFVGIDKGFGYAFGASVDVPMREFVQQKLIQYPAAITRALSKEINKHIDAENDIKSFIEASLATNHSDLLWLGFVEDNERVDAILKAQQSVKGYLLLLPIEGVRHHNKKHQYDGSGQREATAEDYAKIPSVLNEADEIKLSTVTTDTGLPALIAIKELMGEIFRVVFEVRHGKKSRALAIKSLVIKTDGG